ncbi:MAG: 30S ribosomal protein S17e [Euryarchaeota archaeon]|nr:30S ribosomal protein S17e [Euryarchaeota archaeon]|tara:strand:- start:842 stop:1033 length:192 start_codon:yes stop_codon:yes gene_type:complete
MGNIRPSFIKTRALRLIEIYPDQFTDDFDNNKKMVSEFSDVDNKRMRNWIAGYITRYVQRRTD